MKHLALTFVAAAALFAGGCQPPAGDSSGSPESSSNDTTSLDEETYMTSATLCGTCGHESAEGCCEDGCETCECGFHKGSTLCCTGVETGQDYCRKCGHVAAEGCCEDGCAICECGFHEGAPLCCKLEAAEVEVAEEEAAAGSEG